MLHLKARVDFEEVKRFGRRIDDEFDRAGGLILHGLPQAHRRVKQAAAQGRRDVGRGRFLDHFLVAALGRTIALAQGQHAPLAVAENLHLNVPRVLDVFFQVNPGVFEIALAQPLHRGERFGEFTFGKAKAHADPAAAGGALEHDGIADLFRRLSRLLGVIEQPGAGQEGHLTLLGQFARRVLEAEAAHLLARRADEDQPGLMAKVGEIRIFAESPARRF